MKKAKELGKKNEEKVYKKPSMRLESNVGMVRETIYKKKDKEKYFEQLPKLCL